jgi:iron complex transport system substrate-binding protein
MRIVSLLPAATEICFALGLGDDVVGVSPECDYPPAARGKRIVSRTLLTYEGKTSRETSRMVGERLEDGGALYEVEAGSLRTARPDLILTQGLCDVCAPTLGDVEDVARHLPEPPEIVSLDPHRLQDVLADIKQVGRACGIEDRADALIASLEARIGHVAEKAMEATVRPTTVCLEWLAPLFLGGHWIPEMVDLAGGVDVLGRAGEKSRRVEAKEIVMASPQVAVLMPCGFDLERTWKEAPIVTGEPWWADLPAARTGRVWLVDGSGYFNRPGPRLVDGLEILAHILQPGIFPRAPSRNRARPRVG